MLKLEFDGVIDMKIREVNENKKQFIALLLLADEQENMIDHYLEKGIMYVLEDGNEDTINAMLPDKLPKNIQKLYDKGHE